MEENAGKEGEEGRKGGRRERGREGGREEGREGERERGRIDDENRTDLLIKDKKKRSIIDGQGMKDRMADSSVQGFSMKNRNPFPSRNQGLKGREGGGFSTGTPLGIF